MFKLSVQLTVIIIVLSLFHSSDALLRRCFQCRSRGELGSCKDPFTFNATDVEKESGVTAIPCASGWCGKVIEGGGTYAVDDYDQAIQRMCVQRGPDDNQDRCANTIYNYKKVYMCFCQGDLCNGSESIINHKNAMTILGLSATVLLAVYNSYL
ncbi:uncharacterized protein LOC101892114 [Musca domestica]|uniref:Uncharacterized protein LOC101892114 n=1 Tax=Musca domestica TaxID=7370 RepID=A0A1I8NDP3_MUSDO|nr:uncharacterized protein LOC101892114 [Musca domestica]